AFSDRHADPIVRRALTDPNDPDALVQPDNEYPPPSNIQPDHIRSQYLTALYSAAQRAAVGVGDTSFARAEVAFFIKPGSRSDTVLLSPVVFYNGLPVEPGEELPTETIGFFADPDPLAALERYVQDVRDRKQLTLKPLDSIAGLWNWWIAFTEEENDAGAELAAMAYQCERLLPYGIRSLPVGVVWHRDNAFFESRCKPHLGAGLADFAADIAARFPGGEITGGVFWGSASECSDFFQQHPEAILRDRAGNLCRRGSDSSISWTRCKSPAYWVDFSHPAAREFLAGHLRAMQRRVDVRTFNFDFMGDHGAWRGAWAHLQERDNTYVDMCPHDPRLNRPFETDRVPLQTVRETLGEAVVIRSYTALFMRYLGLTDVVRTASDANRVEYGGQECRVDWEPLRYILQNLAANYLFHGKWWWSDACGLCVGTRPIPARREEVRLRALMNFLVGGPITLGDNVAEMTPEQFRYYTMNLPPTGHAARPRDLFTRDLPEIYHLPRAVTGYGHDLLTFLNLSDEPREYDLELMELGLPEACLAFEFWTKELTRLAEGRLRLSLPPHAGRHFALHPDQGVPQVIGTDFHLSMGGVELSGVTWAEQTRTLGGTISRPDDETGQLFIAAPNGSDLSSLQAREAQVVSAGPVIVLALEAGTAPTAWELAFALQD
ncbi:MAG TPA: hypothetical protein QGH10_00445, partial [Armatimonadota bacterium]|nr:hypothetical protein [Armatimonadota bacterium]